MSISQRMSKIKANRKKDRALRAIYRQLCYNCRIEKPEYTLACTIVAACARGLRSGGYTILRTSKATVWIVAIRTSRDVRLITFSEHDGYIKLSAVNSYFPLTYHSEYYTSHTEKLAAENIVIKYADVTIELADPDMMEHLSGELRKALVESSSSKYSRPVNL